MLGYIFEKYINQKEKGAYYTKEDITGYIGQSTIIPFLFDAAHKECRIAFDSEQSVWWLLQADPDRYIYEAVKKGVASPLPPEIAAGLSDIAQRNHWNRTAPEEFALPTEIWREVVARRKRYEEIHRKLAAGEVHSIDDLITYNLDIRQFAQDVIENSEGPELLRAFYHAIEKVTVLDPTCGSGAFLFAALNILEPLYDACLDRMQVFVDELALSGVKHHHEKYGDFRKVLARVERHPNRRYFILKSIIVNNLYGVDIMEEAVEICTLRLFLKLAAQVEQVGVIEPLPDIDFNIRAGNTLVGYAKREEVSKAVNRGTAKQTGLVFTEDADQMARIDESAEIVDRAFQRFHEMQTKQDMDPKDFAETKVVVRSRLETLTSELDRYLAAEYGIDRNNIPNPREREERFRQWKISHQPFHWYAEFYGIMKNGGFDVIIGNPPYVEYSKVKSQYTIKNYLTERCGNLYSFILERSYQLENSQSRSGMIVPLSLACTTRMESLRSLLRQRIAWLSCFDMRPNALFEGVAQRLCIVLSLESSRRSSSMFTGGYRRWTAQERPSLLQLTHFVTGIWDGSNTGPIAKHSDAVENSLLSKIRGARLSAFTDDEGNPVYIHRIVRYYIKALDFIPLFIDSNGLEGKSEDYKEFRFIDSHSCSLIALLNSTLFYWFWRSHADGFHCGYGDVYLMPYNPPENGLTVHALSSLQQQLMEHLRDNSKLKTISTKSGGIRYQEFYPKHSKAIIDEIDRVLAQHYGFTDEELDFIINYDIKYRMGRDAGGADPE
ncbi:conserved hypothetical protein [Nitrolancea hollandica Lb]|uniref:site-specific DNA-methyltransferase (adenine-specific) n=1 Tax=Nitrolancea hollandica Lb TaxID=1129897 RepID=I4EJK5_9BACT|nr:conserved hypothetical protein [Nitrolancea hollandica Lb]